MQPRWIYVSSGVLLLTLFLGLGLVFVVRAVPTPEGRAVNSKQRSF